jgi:dTDP-4-dehydrorhamnose 3,5-epimerase
MIFVPTPLAGLLVVRTMPAGDARGDFARLWCGEEFRAAGVAFAPLQMSLSRNPAHHTLRGMHWQAAPHGETKLVRAQRGVVFDVAVDLRPDSATYRGWFGLELDAAGLAALLIPPGFAHGFLTLSDDAEVLYLIDTLYAPASARGFRFDDPAIGIAWPAAPAVIGDKDLRWPAL